MSDKNINTIVNWKDLNLSQSDLDFIYNYLLEKEVPMTSWELSKAIIDEHIRLFRKELQKKEKSRGQVYRPNRDYQMGEEILFPLSDNQKAKVINIRQGNNPDLPDFTAITFLFEDGTEKEFAGSLQDHRLNSFDYYSSDSEFLLDPEEVLDRFGGSISKKVRQLLAQSDGLFTLADFWFPKALLSEVNLGYLNLAEAALEMEEGQPVQTRKILEAIEYPMDSNDLLTEFSFNYALYKDDRFDEVGPTGKVLWVLKLLEPEDVRKKPLTLKYYGIDSEKADINGYSLDHLQIHDELDPDNQIAPETEIKTFDICINYPHWKAGSLPLIGSIRPIFPTALETDKVIFEFVDKNKSSKFPGWVLVKENYVSGLKQWYRENHIIPGSFIRLRKIDNSTDVEISMIQPRSSKDWIRTALFDSKGKIHFEIRQQPINTDFDERMCIYVENNPQLDLIWDQNNKPDINFGKLVENIFKEISSDNPQGIVHFLELYAAVNMLHRCPPKPLLATLIHNDHFEILDNYYFKINSKESKLETEYE